MNRELEAFSYSVSHDLRGPLSRIAGFSQALLEFHAGQLDEKGRLYLRARSTTRRAACATWWRTCSISRALTRVEMNEEKVDLSAIVHCAGRRTGCRAIPTARRSSSITDGVEAWGDGTLLRAALLNLIENSWKFTRKHASLRDRVRRRPARRRAGLFPPGRRRRIRHGGCGAGCSIHSSDCTRTRISKAPGSDWPPSSESSAGTADASGRKGRSNSGAAFYFTLRQENVK